MPADSMRKPESPPCDLPRGTKVLPKAFSTEGSKALDGGLGCPVPGGSVVHPAARSSARKPIVQTRHGGIMRAGRIVTVDYRLPVVGGRWPPRAAARNASSIVLFANARLGIA